LPAGSDQYFASSNPARTRRLPPAGRASSRIREKGTGQFLAADAADGGVEVLEGQVGDAGGDFAADAAGDLVLVDDERPAGSS
jgi:hypothetical protein